MLAAGKLPTPSPPLSPQGPAQARALQEGRDQPAQLPSLSFGFQSRELGGPSLIYLQTMLSLRSLLRKGLYRYLGSKTTLAGGLRGLGPHLEHTVSGLCADHITHIFPFLPFLAPCPSS